MNLPKGNKLFDKQQLSVDDIKKLTDNLISNKFSGYIELELKSYNWKAIVFYLAGAEKAIFEFDMTTNKHKLIKAVPKLLAKVRDGFSNPTLVSSVYILSEKLVEVLYNFYYFNNKTTNRQYFNKKDFDKLLDEARDNSMYCLWDVDARGQKNLLVMAQGEFVSDPYADYFGDILTSPEKVDEFVNFVHAKGGYITMAGMSMEEKIKRDDDIQRFIKLEKELTVKVVKKGDMIEVDWGTIVSWAQLGALEKYSNTIPEGGLPIDITTPSGNTMNTRCTSNQKGKYPESSVIIPQEFVSILKVKDGEIISIVPNV